MGSDKPTSTLAYTAILNPSSNRGRASSIEGLLRREADRLGLDLQLVVSPGPEAVPELVRDAIDAGRVPVAAGGDGTVNMVARAVLEASGAFPEEPSERESQGGPGAARLPRFGIVPFGTGNDTAASLGIPVKDVAAAAAALASGNSRVVDVLEVRSDDGDLGVSLGVTTAGFDSEVTETAERIRLLKGPVRYTVAVFRTLLTSSPTTFTVTVDDQEPDAFEAWLVAVANGPRYGGGMYIAPGARPDDGLADVCVVGPVSKPHFVRTFPKVFKGKHVEDPAIRLFKAERIRIEARRPFRCFGDGERIGALPVEVRVRPKAIEVVGASPQASASMGHLRH